MGIVEISAVTERLEGYERIFSSAVVVCGCMVTTCIIGVGNKLSSAVVVYGYNISEKIFLRPSISYYEKYVNLTKNKLKSKRSAHERGTPFL